MTKKQKAEKHKEIMSALRKALNDFIDEYEGMDFKNPLEPLKLAAALRSEALKWDLREAEGARHSPLDYTIIAALQTLLTKEVEMRDESANKKTCPLSLMCENDDFTLRVCVLLEETEKELRVVSEKHSYPEDRAEWVACNALKIRETLSDFFTKNMERFKNTGLF